MIEAYALLVALTLQILVVSVLQPDWYARYARVRGAKYQADTGNAELYAGILFVRSERFLMGYRVLNAVAGLLGLGLLAWLSTHILRPDWDIMAVRRLLGNYAMAQLTPLLLVSLTEAWVHKRAVKHAPPEVKRTASLQRRGLFDFVSPQIVFVAGLAYVLFAASLIYILQNPVPGFNYPGRSLVSVTLVYVLNGFIIYWLLYGRKTAPLETRASRMVDAAMGIRTIVYASIAIIVFSSLRITLEELLGMERWVPASMSVFMMLCVFLASTAMRRAGKQMESLNHAPAS